MYKRQSTATRLPGFDLFKSEAVVETILYSSDSAKNKSKIHNFNRQIYKMACKLTKTLDNVAGYRQITELEANRGNLEAI